MNNKRFTPAFHPEYDYWIFMNNVKAREKQRMQDEYDRKFANFREDVSELYEKTPLETRNVPASKIFYCEVRRFKNEKDMIEYTNKPDIMPIGLSHAVFNYLGPRFYSRILSGTSKILDIIRAKKKGISPDKIDYIDDSLTWDNNSLFEVTLFHGSGRYIHYFDEEFLMKQLAYCLISLNTEMRGSRQQILEAFSIKKNENEKTLTIRI
jgi:hypothetical protein